MTVENNTQIYYELPSGTVLCSGKYNIVKKIGEGGFGITYKALQSGLNRTVCIKEYFLAGKCARETHARTVYVQGATENLFEKYRQSFVKEAKMLAALHHPNIVEVIDVFDENNTSYMVMSFIEGKSLQNIVESRRRLPYPEAVNYIAQITNAIGYLHDRHILHRDIKPDNIMITSDYKAILIDFGSAREFEQDKTQVHTSMLTHGYAPTEQYTANSRKGSYTDIYAIGATMYFVLTGQVPLEAAARLTEPMPAPKELAPDIPDEANRTILKAMQIKAENRHQTIQEFMDDLRNVKPSVLVDETIGGKITPKASGKKPFIPIASGIVVVLAIIAFLFLGQGRRHKIILQKYDNIKSLYENNLKTGSPENYFSLLRARSQLDTLTDYRNEYSFISRKRSEIDDSELADKLNSAQKAYMRSANGQYEVAKDIPAAIQNYHIASFIKTTPEVIQKVSDIVYSTGCTGAYMAVRQIKVKGNNVEVYYNGLNQSDLEDEIQYEIIHLDESKHSVDNSVPKCGNVKVNIMAGNGKLITFKVESLPSSLPCILSLSSNNVIFYRTKLQIKK